MYKCINECVCVCWKWESNKCWERTLIFLLRISATLRLMRECKSDCKNCVEIDGDLFAHCFTFSFYSRFIPFSPFSLCDRFFSILLNAHVIASFQSKNHNLIYIQLNIPMLLCYANAFASSWGLACMWTRVAFEIDVKLFNEYNFRRKFHLITQWNQWINVAKSWVRKSKSMFYSVFFLLFSVYLCSSLLSPLFFLFSWNSLLNL